MKFGKKLRRQISPKWKKEYVDYKNLKKILKESKQTKNPSLFTTAFNEELEKVGNFFRTTLQSLLAQEKSLGSRLQAYVEFQDSVSLLTFYASRNYLAVQKIGTQPCPSPPLPRTFSAP